MLIQQWSKPSKNREASTYRAQSQLNRKQYQTQYSKYINDKPDLKIKKDSQKQYKKQYVSEARQNRLNLIFNKQPKQVQAKLMKLLINYNANMQYNKDEDMFQVDLLLPFASEQQKQQFARQFIQIRSKGQQSNRIEAEQNKSNSNSHSKKEKSINNSLIKSQGLENKNKKQVTINILDDLSNQEINPKSIQKTNQDTPKKGEMNRSAIIEYQPQKKINLNKIEQMVQFRISKAIQIINSQKKHLITGEQNNIQFEEENQILFSNQTEKNKKNSNLNEISKSSSKEILIQDQLNEGGANFKYISEQPQNSNYPSQFLPKEIIQENQEQSQYDDNDIFLQINESNPTKRTFEEYQKQFSSVKSSKDSKNNKKVLSFNSVLNRFANSNKKNNFGLVNPKKTRSKEKLKQQKQNISQSFQKKHQQNKNISMPKNKADDYKQFFKQNRNMLEVFYQNVKNQVRIKTNKHRSQQHKNVHDSSILQQFSKQSYIERDEILIEDEKEFKQQMIKQYGEKILVLNEGLSSQDLVKYFRYLLKNAKRLYVKYIKNIKK